MSATSKPLYGTSGQAITITLDSLANSAARQSTAVDNTTTLYEDALVEFSIVSGASGVSATGWVDVYAYGTANGGTTYSGPATGTDGAITLLAPPNLVYIGRINVVANSTTYNGKLITIAKAFGGILPAKWGIVTVNNTGAAFGTGCSAWFQGVNGQSV